jgi:hypothetical protein
MVPNKNPPTHELLDEIYGFKLGYSVRSRSKLCTACKRVANLVYTWDKRAYQDGRYDRYINAFFCRQCFVHRSRKAKSNGDPVPEEISKEIVEELLSVYEVMES